MLISDYLFAISGMVAVALQGCSANRWMEWKDAKGRTLDEVKGQSIAPSN